MVDCCGYFLDMRDRPMLRAYRLVYDFSNFGPPQLWEWEQPYIDHLILNARTFGRRLVAEGSVMVVRMAGYLVHILGSGASTAIQHRLIPGGNLLSEWDENLLIAIVTRCRQQQILLDLDPVTIIGTKTYAKV